MAKTLLRILLTIVGLVLASLGQERLNADILDEGLLLYAGALICWLSAFARAEWLRDDVTPPLRPLSSRAQWIGLGLALLVGIFFRAYELTNIPWGLSIDGSANALKALDILRGAPYEPLYLARETMYHYIVAGFFKVLGPSLLALRLVSVVLGLLALVAMFLAVRELFDARMALLAAALMAVSTYHVTYSRTAWRAIQVPLFELLTLFFVLRALRLGHWRRSWPWWIAGGVSVGLGLNTYEPFRLVVIGLGLFLLTRLRRRQFWRQQLPGLMLFFVFSAIFFGPLGLEVIADWGAFNARTRAVFIGERVRQAQSLQPLWDNLRNLLLTYNYRALGDFFDNQKPLLNPAEAVLLVGGLAVALGNFWRRRPALLLSLFAITGLAGLLSWPNAQRLIATTMLVYVFGALFLYAVWVLLDELPVWRLRRTIDAASNRSKHISGWLAVPAVVAVLVLAAWQTWDTYLGPERRNTWGYEPERLVVAEYVQPLRDSDMVIVEERFNQGQVQFINWRPGDDPFARIFPLYSFERDVPLRRPVARPVTLILEDRPENRALVPIFQGFYPNLVVDELRNHFDPRRSVAFAVRIRLDDTEASWGWKPDGDGWQAMLYVPRLAEYQLSLPDSPSARLRADGHQADAPILLTPGFHLVQVENADQPPSLFRNGRPVGREQLFGQGDVPASLRGAQAEYQPLAWRGVLRFGGHGHEPGRFFRPLAVAVFQPEGDIFVADVDNLRVQRFDAAGNFQLEFGRRGAAPGELEHEFGIGLDGQGRLYLADRWNDRLQAFSTEGDFLGVVAQMGEPRDVLVEVQGTLLVTVPGMHQVWRLSTDGQVLQRFGESGTGSGQFREPIGLAQDAGGNIYVNDAGRKMVLKFSQEGQFLLEWPAPYATWESYVAVSPDGQVYVSSPEENTIHAYKPDGTLLVQGTRRNGYNPFDQPLHHPMGLVFDSVGNLYATSTYSDEVVEFEPYVPSDDSTGPVTSTTLSAGLEP